MTLKGRIIFPVICLAFTIFIFVMAVDSNEFLNFDNGGNILVNLVCLISALLTFSVFFLFSREVYIDTEKLIVKSPFPSFVSEKCIDIRAIKAFKIQSLIKVPGYWLRLYLINEKLDKKETRVDLTFNIKENDLDKLTKRLKELNIKERRT